MSDRIPPFPLFLPDYQEELALARMAHAVYGSRNDIVASMINGRDDLRLPLNWSLLGNEEMRHADNFLETKRGVAAAVFEKEAIYEKRLVLAVRGSDDIRDWTVSLDARRAGPNAALAADAELLAILGVPFAPEGETPKRQMAELQQKVLPSWSWAFKESLDYALKIHTKYESQGYTIEVAGHSSGGSHAQVMSHTFGWGGRTFDAAGARNIIDSQQYRDWCKDNGVVPVGAPEYNPQRAQDTALLNYTVNGSLVSEMTGPHIGATMPITALGGREGLGDYASYAASTVGRWISSIPGAGDLIAARTGLRGPWVDMLAHGADTVVDLDERHGMARILQVFERAAESNTLQQWGHAPDPVPMQRVRDAGSDPRTAWPGLVPTRAYAPTAPASIGDPWVDRVMAALDADDSQALDDIGMEFMQSFDARQLLQLGDEAYAQQQSQMVPPQTNHGRGRSR